MRSWLRLGIWALPGLLLGCQEYAGLAAEEPRDEEATPGCDGGDCGGEAGDQDGDDGGEHGCVVAPPQAMSLSLCGDSWDCAMSFEEPGRVLHLERPGQGDDTWSLWLLLASQRAPVVVRADLPAGAEPPLAVGDSLQIGLIAWTPWWVNQAVSLSATDGLLLYVQIDESSDWEDPPHRCPPVEDPCGQVIHPRVEYRGRVVEQGDVGVLSEDGVPYRYWIGSLRQYTRIDCTDMPSGWFQSVLLTHQRRSACRCQDSIDCALDELCEPYAGQCVPDPCVLMDCMPGYVCDPFRGECVVQSALACQSAAECAADEVCNPATGLCVHDLCREIDCAPCSPLLGGCYGCLHDCDCGLGLCDRESRGCVDGCAADKLGPDLVQENPRAFELGYVCMADRLDDPGEVLRLVEPEAQCGVGPPPGGCPAEAPVACLLPLRRYPNQLLITSESWARLCALSRNPLVRRLIGGHYLP